MIQKVWLLILAVSLCRSAEIRAVLGEDVVFPVEESGIHSILWKFGNDKVADYDPQFETTITYYGSFKERSHLDLKSGNLKISKLTLKDEGKFSVEINNTLSPKAFTLKLFPKVAAVQIERENPGVQPCKLLCKATLSADGDPAELQWSADGDVIGQTELLTVQEDKGFKSYTCTASNPVSSSYKTVPTDSLCQAPTPVWIIVVSCLGVTGVLGAVAVVFGLHKSGRLQIGKTNSNRASNGPASSVEQPLN